MEECDCGYHALSGMIQAERRSLRHEFSNPLACCKGQSNGCNDYSLTLCQSSLYSILCTLLFLSSKLLESLQTYLFIHPAFSVNFASGHLSSRLRQLYSEIYNSTHGTKTSVSTFFSPFSPGVAQEAGRGGCRIRGRLLEATKDHLEGLHTKGPVISVRRCSPLGRNGYALERNYDRRHIYTFVPGPLAWLTSSYIKQPITAECRMATASFWVQPYRPLFGMF